MAAFEDYRKKLSEKYGTNPKKEEEKEDEEKKSVNSSSNSSSGGEDSFSSYRNKLMTKYGGGIDSEGGKSGLTDTSSVSKPSSQGMKGYQKYLDDVEVSKKKAIAKEEEKTWWEKFLDIYVKGQGMMVSDNPVANTVSSNFNAMVDYYKNDVSYMRPSDDWDDEQRAAFGQLYLESPEKAYAYAEETNKKNNIAKEEKAVTKIQDSATSDFLSGAGHTVGAIATAPLGLADFFDDLAKTAAGREITSDGTVSPFEYSQAVTGGISTHLNDNGGTLDEDIPIIGGKGWGDVYSLGTSIAQSMASGYLLGPAGTLVSYFGQSAASGVDDALSRGATEEQAILYGAALGTFEGVAEQIGIDNLFKLGSASTIKGLIKNIVNQAKAEGAEEGLTSFLSNIADNVIMQDKSNFDLLVAEYMAQGMSEDEAKRKAWRKSVEGILFDTIAGAASGSVSGGLRSGVQTAITNSNAKKNYSGQVEDLLVEAGTNENLGKADGKYVDKYVDKYGKNGELSGWNISHLLEITDNSKVKSAVEAQLTKLGESGDISALAEVITKQAQGIELSKKEQKILDNSTNGQEISKALDPESIKSGAGASDWVKNIGTRRLNADVYNKSVYDYVAEAIEEENKASAELAEMDSVTENSTDAETSAEREISSSVEGVNRPAVKAVMNDTEGNEVEVKPQRFALSESGEMGVEVEGGKVVNATEVDFGDSDIGLVHQAAVDMSSRVGGFSVDTANVFVNGYNEATGQSAGAYIDGWISAYKFGALKNPPPLSALAANPKTAQLTEEQRKTAYNFGRAFGNEKVVTNKKSEGFVGEYTKRSYNSEQAELLSALPVEALQNAVDSNGALSFNSLGLGGDKATQQKWIDAGLTYTEDGKVYVDENAVLDERDRRRKALKETKSAEATSQKETTPKKNGRVIFDGMRYGKRLNERQRASLKALNFISKALGIDIYVDKLAKGDNGWYDPSDRSIHVDLNAGVAGEALMLFAMSHELTHDIRATLPEKFNLLADAVFEEYTKRYSDHVMEDLIEAKIDFLKEKGDITEDMTEEEAYDLAYEEVICDCCETLLADSNAIEALSENIYAKDKKLWQKIKDFFARIVARIKAAYEGVDPDSEEGQRFRDLGEGAERIKNLWVEAIVELSATESTTGEGNVKHSYSSIAYSFFGDKKVTVKDFENGSYTKTEGYMRYVENCLNNMRQSVEEFNEAEARREIEDSIAGIVNVAVAMKKAGYDILDNHAKRNAVDSKNRLLFSSLEPNSDYFTSSDISTICDKRINFAEIYDEIVRREEALGVPKGKRFFDNVDNYFILHKIMADKGLTQPCRQCYVESMRKNLAPMANAFLELMQETDPDNKANKQLYQPSGKSKGELKSNNAKLRENLLETIAEEEYTITANDLTVEMLTTEDGLAQLKLQAPLIYEAFNSFYGQSKPKMPKSATPFRFGELTAMLTDNKGKIKKSLIDKIMSTGGFRLQSYSDFQIQNFADVLQVIFEAGTLGLSGHAYTKVPAFLDATKGTNLKRNISIFMYNDGGEWKIDRNDSFPYDLEKIYDIVKSDKQGNTSIIAVSQNEMMSAFIMANDNIGYFIPFHKSGMKMGTVRETTVKEGGREIKGYSGIKDHTRQQTEVWAKNTADHKANTKVKKGINIYEFWDFDNVDNLSREGLIEKNVRAYIDACNEAGYLPKFREYVMNNSKVLNAVLNYSKQLGFVSQNATVDDISFEYKGYRIPYGYYKCLGDFGMFTPDGEASPIERLSLKDYDFDEAVAFFSNAESLRRNEILQQIANGEERERYRNSDMTTAEIAEEVQAKRNQVVDEVVSGEYKKKPRKEASKLKETDLVNLLKEVKAKKLADGTYIPVRINTPQILIAFAKEYGYTLENLPLAMRVYKARQAVSSVEEWDGDAKDTPHNLTPNEIIEIIRAMDNPSYLVYQTKNDRFAEIVKFDMGKEKAYAIIDFSDVHKNADIMNGYNGGKYNILVTVYPSDDVQELKNYLKNKNNKVMTGEEMKKKGLSQRGLGSYVPAHLNESPFFEDIVPQNPDSVKRKFSHKPSKKATYAPTFYSHMGKVIDDVKLEKMGTSSILNHLKNRGVKDEEIKWSGIETFLDGKKSVTKAELQEFVAGSQLVIEETTIDNTETPMTKERKDKITTLESERNKLVDKVKSEWRRVLGTDELDNYTGESIPYDFNLRLTTAIVAKKGETAIGQEYKAAQNAVKAICEESDYFGYNNARQAYTAILRDPDSFLGGNELTPTEEAAIRRLAKAKEAWLGFEGVPASDLQRLKDLGEDIQSIDAKITAIRIEHSGEQQLPRWGSYKLKGGENYREMVFQMPGSDYTNAAMDVHWGGFDLKGVVAHARVQDFEVDGKKMLFIEEIQSDWHNEGHKRGYESDQAAMYKKVADLKKRWMSLYEEMLDAKPRSEEQKAIIKTMDAIYEERETLQRKADYGTFVPDAPFSINYHEYVLKRLLRMAAEEGYDSIGWTPAEIQDERWADKQAHEEGKGKSGNLIGYTIEYDQEMPKFLRKYGKKWGATVGTATVSDTEVWSMSIPDSMKESVLYEGQPLYQHRNSNGMKPRTLLANALETAVSEDEKNLLQTYKENIDKLNSEQEKLDKVMSEIDEIRFKKSLSILGEEMSVKTFETRAKAKAKKNGINAEDVQFKLDRSNKKYIAYAVGHGTILEADKTFRSAEDNAKLNELWGEAKDISTQINTYDRELLRLQAMQPIKEVLKREKAQAVKRAEEKAEQRRKESVERVKESAAKTRRELMDRYQESRKKATEGRNKTAMRHKIKDVVTELNNYLLKGTKDKHVPIELQKPVAEALDAVNMDTVGAEERIAKLKAEMMSAKTPEAIQEIAKKIEHIEEMGGNMEAKLSRLKTAYDSIINSEDPLVANSHDDVISSTIEKVMEYVGETPLRDMSLHQLEAVYDMYRMVLHSIRGANKAFKAKKSEEISVIANRVMEEIDKLKKRDKLQTETGEAISTFDWNNQKPVYAFERIGSDTFTEVFNNVRAGEDTWAADMEEAKSFREEQVEKYKYDSWDFDKRYDFTSSTGKKFSLSLGQIMSLYAYSKRGEQAKEHLRNGGFVFDGLTEVKKTEEKEDDKGKKKKIIERSYLLKDSTAYNLSDEILSDIISKLTAEQKAFADVMQDYLSTTMGEKGNEVSLELYGVKLFKEKNYFPLKSDTHYLERAREQAQGETKIKNKGFTKETTPKARNPIVLTSFMDVWAGHVNEMSMYHAFTLALEDFYRVYNYKTPASETLDSESVISFLENAHGNASVAYIDQLLKDLNGGARSDPRATFGNKLLSNFKRASTMASLSVLIQQPSSIIRAQALVDAKYFGGKKVSKDKHKETWAEVKKYAPVAVIKEMGYFDTGMGKSSTEWLTSQKYHGIKENAKALVKDGNYRDEVLSKLPALADEYTWCAIWNAVKRETAHNNPTLKTSSEEFLKLCGERFTEVVTKTQVYDSTLARSSNMRSKDGLMKMWTAFMAEPTTSINMLQDAFKKGNKKQIARTIGAVYGSVLLNSALVSLIYAIRDDDEDETFLEKYLSRLISESIDGINPLTYIPFVKDIWSLLQGYDIERADMSLISDLFGSLQQLTKAAIKYSSDMSDEELAEYKKEVAEKILGVTDSLASLTGLPVKNIRRDLNGIINAVMTIIEDAKGRKTTGGSLGDNILEGVKDTVPVWGWFPDESKGDKLYDAIVKGDTAYEERLKSGYKNINSAIRKALKENDPRIKEAAVAFNNDNFRAYSSILDEIVNEGHFSLKNVKSAILTLADDMLPKEESTETEEEKAVSRYDVDMYYKSISSGDTHMANIMKNNIIDTDVANGKSRDEAEDDFNSSFRSFVGNMYKDGEISRSTASNMLTTYGGYDSNETYWKLKEWDFRIENGEDASYSKYNDFYEAVKTGSNLMSVISEYTSHEVKPSTLASQITSYFKPLYIQMSYSERAYLKGYLLNAYAALGYNRYEKSRDIDKWLNK